MGWAKKSWRKVAKTVTKAASDITNPTKLYENIGEEAKRVGDRYQDADWKDWKTWAYAITTGPTQQGVSAQGTLGGTTALNPFNRAPTKGGGGGGGVGGIEAPPTIDEANGPGLSEQFKRMRSAARALGRAGTIKGKGTGNFGGTLGSGGGLGSGMSLQGS